MSKDKDPTAKILAQEASDYARQQVDAMDTETVHSRFYELMESASVRSLFIDQLLSVSYAAHEAGDKNGHIACLKVLGTLAAALVVQRKDAK